MKNTDLVMPGLFGLEDERCNRKFSNPKSWGKNQFNSSFPTALACYMAYIEQQPVYIVLDENRKTKHKKIDVSELFTLNYDSSNLYFSFEADFPPYRTIVLDKLPKTDLVIMDKSNNQSVRCLEVKLTALPDNSTYKLEENKYGCEIVIRPVTIIYLALGIANKFKNNRPDILNLLEPICSHFHDWKDLDLILPQIPLIINLIDELLVKYIHLQEPLVLQPIWKTQGKTFMLSENCLDMFVWSNFAFTRLFFDAALESIKKNEGIGRYTRSVIWLAKMLYDFGREGKISCEDVVKKLTYNAQSDKAFALNGSKTNSYMISPELIQPRIKKTEIKNIILGGGQNLLSPERRFDAAILNNLDIFIND
ncbi:MAG TPA: HindVP family restriction endonuclease [Nostocaceae cyanobacterium]|nr:HindVP family restriction endonuclease [Nostocaceae cyanobacterium]